MTNDKQELTIIHYWSEDNLNLVIKCRFLNLEERREIPTRDIVQAPIIGGPTYVYDAVKEMLQDMAVSDKFTEDQRRLVIKELETFNSMRDML